MCLFWYLEEAGAPQSPRHHKDMFIFAFINISSTGSMKRLNYVTGICYQRENILIALYLYRKYNKRISSRLVSKPCVKPMASMVGPKVIKSWKCFDCLCQLWQHKVKINGVQMISSPLKENNSVTQIPHILLTHQPPFIPAGSEWSLSLSLYCLLLLESWDYKHQ